MESLLTLERFDEITSRFASIKPIMVVGDVCLDKYTYGVVERISPEAPVPVLQVTKEWFKLGMASNVSDNLKSLTAPSTLCGIVGEDKSGSMFKKLLLNNNLTDKAIISDEHIATIVKERVMTNAQQICRVDYEREGELVPEVIDKISRCVSKFSYDHDALIIEDYGKGLLTEKLCQNLISIYKEQKKLVAVDPSRKAHPKWYKGATLLKPNLIEARIMVEALGYHNEKNVETMAKILIDKLELEKLVITLGPEGMALCDTSIDNRLHLIPTVANEVFDVSGAGDTAISAITASLVAKSSLIEAAWIGNCGSGVAVGKKGTASVTIKELKEFFWHLRRGLKNRETNL
ncbi:MAG: bifunctional heptose 7-phosphate kinase/heptose 1-phosphate adenyltransferase [Bacteriovoracia bacterium]